MSSALASVGLAVSDEAEFGWLLKSACTDIREIGTFDGVRVGRWQDDSGAALILGLHDGQIVDFTTTYTGSSGALLALGQRVSGPARITALGTDVTIYPDPAACAAAPASHIPGTAPEPPPDYTGPWPPRLTAESFISHAALADSPEKQSRARLSGTVLDATPDLCALTGQPFTADLCLAASDHPEAPEPGSIISGTVVMSAAIDSTLLNTAQA